MAVLETVRAGVPVVTTGIDSNVKLIDNEPTGFLTTVDDIAGIGRRVEQLLTDRTPTTRVRDRAASMIATRWSGATIWCHF
ncbi:MAG: glycosyltransferase [Acidobacteriota bacterium]|nr:glycosyltransferase [Acidobacteriota bacterium]